MKTPNLKAEELKLSVTYVNKILGMEFSGEDVKALLLKMRFGVKSGSSADELIVSVPPYRADILHQIDLVEDVAIAYGYDKFSPLAPKLSTYGRASIEEDFAKSLRELLIGFSFQEVTTLILTNKNDLFTRMGVSEEKVTATSNSVASENSVARSWLLPSLFSLLEHNKNREYPQKLFEVGHVINGEGATKRKLTGVIAHAKANFSEIKAAVFGILTSLGISEETFKITESNHPSFISGRRADISGFGFFGEIHPKVLEAFSIEVPVSAFELDFERIFSEVISAKKEKKKPS